MKAKNETVALYKTGGNERVWNTKAHILIVEKKDAEQYIADGWLDHPSKLFDEAKDDDVGGIETLKSPEELAAMGVEDLKAHLDESDYSGDILFEARALEVNGKNRKTALEVYDAALA